MPQSQYPLVVNELYIKDTLNFYDENTTYNYTLKTSDINTNTLLQLPSGQGVSGQVIVANGDGTTKWSNGSGVSGPTSSLLNSIARFSDTTGNQLDDSLVTIDGSGNMIIEGRLRIKRYLQLEDPGTGLNTVNIEAPTLSASYNLTMPSNNGLAGQVLTNDGNGVLSWTTPSGSGDVTGPTTSTNFALPRFSGTSGNLLLDSSVIVDDSNNLVTGGFVKTQTSFQMEDPGSGSNTISLTAPTLTGDYTLTFPTSVGTSGQFLSTDGSGVLSWSTPSGSGDVNGPASSTNTAIALFGDTSGKTLINSLVTIDASGNVTTAGSLTSGSTILKDSGSSNTITLTVPTLSSSYTLTLPTNDGTNGQILVTNGSGVLSWNTPSGGDVTGPGSSTDEALVRFDGTTGKLLQNSTATLTDTGILSVELAVRSPSIIITQSSGSFSSNFGCSASQTADIDYVLPTNDGSTGQVLTTDGSGILSWTTGSAGGDVTGPGSSTDNAISTFDGTTGKTIQNTSATIDSSGNLVVNGTITTSDSIRIQDDTSGNYISVQSPTIASNYTFYLPNSAGSSGQVLTSDGTETNWTTLENGDVSGPASSTDNAIPTFNGTDGKTIQNTSVTINSSGNIYGKGFVCNASNYNILNTPTHTYTTAEVLGGVAQWYRYPQQSPQTVSATFPSMSSLVTAMGGEEGATATFVVINSIILHPNPYDASTSVNTVFPSDYFLANFTSPYNLFNATAVMFILTVVRDVVQFSSQPNSLGIEVIEFHKQGANVTELYLGSATFNHQYSTGFEGQVFIRDGVIYTAGLGAANDAPYGDSDFNNTTVVPKACVDAPDSFMQIVNTYYNIAGLGSDGKVYICGAGSNGELGNAATADRNYMEVVPGLTDVYNIFTATSYNNTGTTFFAITNTGSLYAWGTGTGGQIGDGTTNNSTSPKLVSGGWVGNGHTIYNVFVGATGSKMNIIAVDSNGTSWGWGANDNSCLGISGSNISTPTEITGLPATITKAAFNAGVTDSCLILLSNGTIWGSGSNSQGQLGVGDTTDKTVFTQEALSKTDWVDVGIFGSGTISGVGVAWAIDSSGNIYFSGYAADGTLGNGTTTPNISTFTQPTDSGFQGSVGKFRGNWGPNSHMTGYIITTNGDVYAAGKNSLGQCGLGYTSSEITTYTKMLLPAGSVVVDAMPWGYNDQSGVTLALESGKIVVTGSNNNGMLGINYPNSYLSSPSYLNF